MASIDDDRRRRILNPFHRHLYAFDLAMRAVDGFKGSKEAIERYVAEEMQALRETLTEALKCSRFALDKHWAFSEEGLRWKISLERLAVLLELDTVVNRIRPNKLVLMVTLLESLLKDVHREVLRQNPSLLKADRQIPLGKLISGSPNEIIEEEIEREVQSMDRKSVKQKAEYFDKHLNVSWFDGTIVPLVERVIRLRNNILHEDPDTLVSEDALKPAQFVCVALPMGCVMQAAVLYPKGFKWLNTNLDGLKEIMTEQGRLKPN